MRFAYADPPYPGQAKKHYGPDAREVNLPLLIRHLRDEFDGWALSTGSTMIPYVVLAALEAEGGIPDTLPHPRDFRELLPDGYRWGPWTKPMAFFKRGVNPAYAWEPVLFYGGRDYGLEEYTRRDFVSANVTFERGTVGAKPEPFSCWIFEMLNVKAGDEFVDVFPGSGAVTDALEGWLAQSELPLWKVRGGPALGEQTEAAI